MEFNDDKVREVLDRLPSEEPCVDYKIFPYKENQRHEFLKDVISMLNSEEGMGKDKYIIFGVDNRTRHLVGIDSESWKDDNEWQNLLDKISPRPAVNTGCVKYADKWFGYVLISAANHEWVYEMAESVISHKDDDLCEKNIIAHGQAYTRRGSKKYVMMENDRKRLLGKRTPNIRIDKPVFSGFPMKKPIYITLSFIAAWDENYDGDRETIEAIAETDFKTFTEQIRRLSEQDPGLLSYSDGCWKLIDHKDFLMSQADLIFNDHVEQFFNILDTCFRDIDPKYLLSSDKRLFATLYNKNKTKQFSMGLCHGLAETLAIMGNNPGSFTKCTRYKMLNNICLFIRDFFKATDWRTYATYADELQLLGEAYPEIFLDEIGRLAAEKDIAFVQFLKEKEESFLTSQYGYQLGWVLSEIAMLEKFFSKAMVVLLLLGQIRSEFLETMVGIVLPWLPQTHASITMRVAVFRGLAQENLDLTWQVLMKLMPRVTTVATPVQEPQYMKIDPISETVSMKEYRDASIGYIGLATELMGTDVDRIMVVFSVNTKTDSFTSQPTGSFSMMYISPILPIEQKSISPAFIWDLL